MRRQDAQRSCAQTLDEPVPVPILAYPGLTSAWSFAHSCNIDLFMLAEQYCSSSKACATLFFGVVCCSRSCTSEYFTLGLEP